MSKIKISKAGVTLLKKVSIIIPCYNQGKYLEESISSVLNSSYQNIEIIVINDGSNEPLTLDILEKISRNYKNIKVITTPNQGVCNARNTGIKAACGEYILPLDCDDKIGDKYIEKAVDVLENNPNIGIVYCKAQLFGVVENYWDLKPATTRNMLIQNRIFATSLFRKSDFLQVGGYKQKMELGCEDWDLWLSIIENGYEIFQIPEIMFFYRIDENFRTKKANRIINFIKINIKIFKLHYKLYFKHKAVLAWLHNVIKYSITHYKYYRCTRDFIKKIINTRKNNAERN